MAVVKERRTSRAKPKARTVLLSRRQYDRIMEDLHDLAVVAERREEPTMTVKEMKKRLRKRGAL